MKEKIFTAQPFDHGFEIHLNNAPVITPAGKPLIVPTEKLSQQLIQDLNAGDGITLPLQLTYTAIDQPHEAMIPDCLHFLNHDCILYWSKDSDEQAEYFKKHLAPALRVISEKTGCVLSPSNDLSTPAVPEKLQQLAKNELQNLNAFAIVGFREITSLLGSYLLAHLIYHAEIEIAEAIRLSLIEQHFQRTKWGTTDTHENAEEELTRQLENCVTYLSLCDIDTPIVEQQNRRNKV